VIAWPFDFSWSVAAALDSAKPSLVVLAESELWPNFLAGAQSRSIPVVVVNMRLSPRSFRRLILVAGAARRVLFRKIARFAVQEREYADRLVQLGVQPGSIITTGSMKYDGVAGDRGAAKTLALRRALGLDEGRAGRWSVLLAGSTHHPEESIVLSVFTRLRARFPSLRLLLVPRHPDRFDTVASLLEASGLPFVRRTQLTAPPAEPPPVVLLDSVGELNAAWGLADLGFTGGSLDGVRGGQSMIEPAGYGVPCVFGPHIWNFRAAAHQLVAAGGGVMVHDEGELEEQLAQLIADPSLRARMGAAAWKLVRQQQGATARTLDVIDAVIDSRARARAA
jgi:3-deoxy-D-manno-octulosonic-acid transferase